MSHPPSRGFALAGDYHFAVGVAESSSTKLRGVPVPVLFSIGVDGEVTGVPDYERPDRIFHEDAEAEESPGPDSPSVEPTATSAPETSPPVVEDAEGGESPGDGSALPWVGAGLVAVGALGATAWALLRRRPRP